TGNINERTWNTQRKALYARFSQAISLMPSLNGYGKIVAGTDSQSVIDTAAETFITNGLSKVLKINNICDVEHLEDCGIPSKINPMNAGGGISLSGITKLSGLNSVFANYGVNSFEINAGAFETANGESILVYYYPACRDALDTAEMYMIHSRVCANFVYDLNGTKGPNTVGKDIGFITVFYPTDSVVVAPMPVTANVPNRVKQINASAACTAQNPDSRLPNLQELGAIYYNMQLVGISGDYYWSGAIASNGQAWLQSFASGTSMPSDRDGMGYYVRCINR
ncbi:MAG: hypothetical protein NC390_07650, partial [Fusobacterium sp.]|nr:hypothetical protein [Fusobacterium sp.]